MKVEDVLLVSAKFHAGYVPSQFVEWRNEPPLWALAKVMERIPRNVRAYCDHTKITEVRKVKKLGDPGEPAHHYVFKLTDGTHLEMRFGGAA